MTLDQIRSRIASSEPARRLFDALASNRGSIPFHGASGSLPAFLLAHLRKTSDRQILVITPTTETAEEMRDDLDAILGEDYVRYFPDWELIPFEEKSPHVEVTALRLEALQALLIASPVIIVAPVTAVLRPTLEPEGLAAASRVVRVNDLLDFDEFARSLRSLSFEPANQVQEMGQYSRRGGVMDIFTFGSENPFRIELFGDEVESIRRFDPATQRSTGEVREIEILPRREVLSGVEWWGDARERVERAENEFGVNLEALRERLDLGIHFEGIEFWCPLLSGVKPSLFDHLDKTATVFLSDPESIAEQSDRFEKETTRQVTRRIEKGEPALPPELVFHRWDDLLAAIPPRNTLSHHALAPEVSVANLGAQGARRYDASLEAVREDIKSAADRGFFVNIFAENESQARRLEELLESSIDLISVGVAKLHGGFVYPAAELFVVNDHELFNRYTGRHRFRKFRGATPVGDVFSLAPDEVIVHEEHGIGVYQKLERITVDRVSRDCLRVLYRDQDRLFVPVDQINRVQRYSQDGEARPVLSKLGGADWDRVKERTRKGVLKLAQELIDLYAVRQSQPGFAFSPDSTLMQEMEAAFIYDETRDQARAINQVKTQMESSVPMDLLLCGDVGYGKTEVAMRAAFKAVCDGKQVAVLVPTTILAQQHFRTFSERFAGFPVKVDVLSRFRSKQEIQESLFGMERGRVDVVIGTHRLLSEDVKFKDLGLLVIDEEHRFGVRHKERLKHLRQTVDVMSMTATPIPRTLYLSLMGARDMAVINTPPRDRLPVHTEVIAFDDDRISEAILRETGRSGQVFFVHNRVQTIEERAEHLKEHMPELRLHVAHGQMSEHQLEKVMLDFLEHRFDCLVTTMIIQSGLDMPNVNTILVDRSDQFGLAELYQLRGRVGRSNHKAFAYLMVPKDRKLTPESRRRLRAIEEFSDLGSGFRVAMRDLEIRGAGNLLGNEQSGFISAVGFDTYVKLLDDAVKELKGERVERRTDCDVDVRVSAFLPDTYVSDGEQKLALYRRLSEALSLDEVNEFSAELRDRFGRLPEPADALIDLMRIKVVGRAINARRISVDKSGKVRVVFATESAPDAEQIGDLVRRSPVPLEFKADGELVMEMKTSESDGQAQAKAVSGILETLVAETATGGGENLKLVWEER